MTENGDQQMTNTTKMMHSVFANLNESSLSFCCCCLPCRTCNTTHSQVLSSDCCLYVKSESWIVKATHPILAPLDVHEDLGVAVHDQGGQDHHGDDVHRLEVQHLVRPVPDAAQTLPVVPDLKRKKLHLGNDQTEQNDLQRKESLEQCETNSFQFTYTCLFHPK